MPLDSFTALAILRREVRRNRRDADDRPARRICIHVIPVMSLPWNALVLQERQQRQKSKGLDLETVGGLILPPTLRQHHPPYPYEHWTVPSKRSAS